MRTITTSLGGVVGAGMLALLLGTAACSQAEPVGSCPPDSDAAQAQGRAVVIDQCNFCHDSARTGASRQDAPNDLNFDQLDVVRQEAEKIYGTALHGSMPPDPYPQVPEADAELMRVWLACGAQDVALP